MPGAAREKTKHPITRLFVANRGEIAVRIVEACRKLGIETVVGVSDADRQTLAAKMADRAICIGPALATESYLRMEAIVTVLKVRAARPFIPATGFSRRTRSSRACARSRV